MRTRISSPISSLAEIEPLVTAGADEFYCGVLSGAKSISARPATTQFNFKDFRELEKAVKICHSFNKAIWLTLNYLPSPLPKQDGMDSDSQFMSAFNVFRRAAEVGIDGVMVADMRLLSAITSRKFGLKLASSTMLPALNSECIDFLSQFKIDRVVLERHMSIKEIQSLDTNIRNIELEILVSGRCTYINAFCKLSERLELPHSVALEPPGELSGKHTCGFPLTIHTSPMINQVTLKRRIIRSVEGKTFRTPKKCSLCALFHFNRLMNTAVLKLVDRGLPLESKIKALLPVRKAVDFLSERLPDFQNYVSFCRETLFKEYEFPSTKCSHRYCNYKPT